MEIRKMNKTDLEHWRELRKQLWPGHPDDAHLADGEEILQADHLTSFIALDGGVVVVLQMRQFVMIMSTVVTVRPWLFLKAFCSSLVPPTWRSETIDCSSGTMGSR